ncbi:guanylate kinase [Sedimentibacter acidaminivorans]|uniref:Guanylate kinase n=1 Tax=Sedimentibacter acidaminivorans TaxID=913099 RepID=A0ABS4GB24_9FIRM|nr:guanylate kinase [Sedimentibacter acidaminivorans]MBP1924879.1 guanylate kinase [Sedimentibacter acidaminivorans]
MSNGLLVVISGPSGSGKGTICKRLIDEIENINVSVSATTRKPRVGEIEGKNYFFIDEDDFVKKINNDEFLEHALVYGNYYGTPKKIVLKQLEEGKDIILEIDIQGALKVKENYPKGVFIFILPPSLEELKNRIEGRGTDSKEVIHRRLKCAYDELNYAFEYDYVVLNDEVDSAVEKIKEIISAEKNKSARNQALIKKIKEV